MGKGYNTEQKLRHFVSARLSYTDFTAASGTTVNIGAIPKGSLIREATVHVITAFTQTTAVILAGTSGDDDQFIASNDVGELTAGPYNSITCRQMITADCDVLAKMTWGTTLVAGEFFIAVEYIPPVDQQDMPTQFDT